MRHSAVTLLCFWLAACATTHKPLPPQPSVYVVAFPRASLAISQRAAAVINSIAADANRHRTLIVQVTGPPTKKQPGYNPGLAAPRMVAVERALIAPGVDRNRIIRNIAAPEMVAELAGGQEIQIRVVEKPVS